MEAEPKSASLTCPGSVNRMLPAFTSLRRKTKKHVSVTYSKLPIIIIKNQKNCTCGSCCGSEGRPVPAELHVWWQLSLLLVKVFYELEEKRQWELYLIESWKINVGSLHHLNHIHMVTIFLWGLSQMLPQCNINVRQYARSSN